ncbi:hypothetical protein [Altericroceibacterium xinjiangense]|uniref:hypothetical protein n=1 Tax=Altericroceibacterium xinjiangense TaxID=762261 RepID=UPI000F7E6D8B|nr:hypothetical protein [Altericroceibacterium xinjiangense]
MRSQLLVLAPLALIAAPLAAQDHPDLSGFWSPASGDNPDPALMDKLPPETAVLDDTGIAEFPKGEFGGLKLKPEASARAQQWNAEDEMTLARVCAAPSMVYSLQGPFPFEIHQTPELIVFKHEYFDQVRLVFMDGRGHLPADAPHSKTGHSIGHWEGDELVIDTTHLAPATITNNGLDHSAAVHMVERYKLSPDGTTLMATQWFEDPEVLDNTGARYIAWTRKPGEHVYPYDCDPSFAVQYQQAGASAP